MTRTPIQLVWLKRDLRIDDHLPLLNATKAGPTIVLYVFEPKLWQMPEMDRSHFDFILQSLRELQKKLEAIGGKLAVRIGELPEVFSQIAQSLPIAALHSHEETGNGFTYERDKQVAKWARSTGIPWHQSPQNGVIRTLKSRDGWAELWQQRMIAPLIPTPTQMVIPNSSTESFSWGELPTADSLGLTPSSKSKLQPGGASHAANTLQSFLTHRSQNYRQGMSSPVTSRENCSRLSPYLAWGCISIRTVYQQLQQRQQELRSEPASTINRQFSSSLNSFSSRLSWHCHFMQKLEDEPQLEFQNLSRAYDGMRENDFNLERFEAWKIGQTGYPMIDACMRALLSHSWINFRMRAMLMSFAANHLWLHWRPTAIHLAKHFLDFEPGIHFSQCQMQSGTTGINTLRIYSPAKQVVDQDPTGIFIRQFVPELANVPNEFLPEPHLMPLDLQSKVGCIIGKNYPPPIVDHRTAYKQAQTKVFAIRKTAEAHAEAEKVFLKHGSRKRPTRENKTKRNSSSSKNPKPKTGKVPQHKQLPLFDDGNE